MRAPRKKRRARPTARHAGKRQAARKPAPPPRYNRDRMRNAGKAVKAGQAAAPTASSRQVPAEMPGHAARAHEGEAGANMCHGCSGVCCGMVVELTPFDIARVAHGEGINPKDFVEFVPADKSDRFGFVSRDGIMKMVLRKEGGACVFERPGALRCGIERSKPAVCLVYPYNTSYGIPFVQREAVCPKENLARANQSKVTAQVVSDCAYEARRYEEAVLYWNRHAKGTEEHHQFLLFAAGDIDSDRRHLGVIGKHVGRLLFRIGVR
jgi:Fe-S-cluster containining protein